MGELGVQVAQRVDWCYEAGSRTRRVQQNSLGKLSGAWVWQCTYILLVLRRLRVPEQNKKLGGRSSVAEVLV